MRIIFGSYTGIYEWFFLRSYPIATAICYVGVVEGVMYMFDILSPPPKFRPYKELFRCLVGGDAYPDAVRNSTKFGRISRP